MRHIVFLVSEKRMDKKMARELSMYLYNTEDVEKH
jgi:hypothetical protein